MWETVIEFIGYIASAFVAISLLMVSLLKLRVLNLIGAFAFTIYGILIGAIPIIITNTFITLIDIYFLIKLVKSDTNQFSYISIKEKRKYKLYDYIENYKDDIIKHYPLFNYATLEYAFNSEKSKVYLALKGFKTVGFSSYVDIPLNSDYSNVNSNIDGDIDFGAENPCSKEIIDYVKNSLFPEQSIYLFVDYVTNKYRDIGLVNKLYKEVIKDINRSEIKFIISINENANKKHHKFLTKNGYKKEKDFGDFSLYVFTLD